MNEIQYAQLNTLRARFHQKAGDEAQAIAQSVKPKMFAKAEDREEYNQALADVAAERYRQSVAASIAADALLRAAGYSSLTGRARRRR